MKNGYTIGMTFLARFITLYVWVLLVLPGTIHAAELYIDPQEGTYSPGETFMVLVRLHNAGECINAANVELSYPTDILRAVDFSRGDSIFSMWAVEPLLDTTKGTVSFAGGIPGGYCGRIEGDPSLSNILGKAVFTVIGGAEKKASIDFISSTRVYLNDGAGTPAALTTRGTLVRVGTSSVVVENPWLKEIKEDTTPPEAFAVEVESTAGVFGGKYYAVFSTIDKQSGLDHFEIHEGNGWRTITSPYVLRQQSLIAIGPIEIRAVDKAGNMRLGEYTQNVLPPRQFSYNEFIPFGIFLLIVLLAAAAKFYFNRKHAQEGSTLRS
jgi:hypothetical protein